MHTKISKKFIGGVAILLLMVVVANSNSLLHKVKSANMAETYAIPSSPPPYDTDASSWWAINQFNPNSSAGNYVPIGAITPPVNAMVVNLTDGQSIQSAIDNCPAEGCVINLAIGTYSNFNLIGKNNIHFIGPADRSAVITGTSNIVSCQMVMGQDVSRFDQLLLQRDSTALACATTLRPQNIYFKDLTFDGGTLPIDVFVHEANGLIFDHVTFKNDYYDDGSQPHPAAIQGADSDNIWVRGAHSIGPNRWAFRYDGCHACGIVESEINSDFGDPSDQNPPGPTLNSGGLALVAMFGDETGDYNGDGILEDNEKRISNHVVIANNTIGQTGMGRKMPKVTTFAGAHVLVMDNTLLSPADFFVRFAGECQMGAQLNYYRVDYTYYDLNAIGNQLPASPLTNNVFTHLDGSRYNCTDSRTSFVIGQYQLKKNVVNTRTFVYQPIGSQYQPFDPPQIVCGNTINGMADVSCDILTPQPTLTPTPIATPTPVPTTSPSPSPTPVSTNTPSPSPTPVSTNTPTPSPSPTPVSTNTPTPTPSPTSTAIPSPTPTPVVNNLLKNSGFELDTNADNKPDNWTNSKYFSRSNAVVHGGSWAGKHSASSNTNYTVSQVVPVTGGKSYTFSGWVNIPPTTKAFGFNIEVQWLTANKKVISSTLIKGYSGATTGWDLATLAVNSPTNAVSAQINLNLTSFATTVYVDDFELK